MSNHYVLMAEGWGRKEYYFYSQYSSNKMESSVSDDICGGFRVEWPL